MRLVSVLQAGRAIAALAVVVHHATAATDTFAQGIPDILRTIGGYGYLGVDFFFVLSGFIIYYTRGKDWRFYAKSRFVRVYLPYVPIGVGMAVAYTLFPNVSAGTREWSWLASLTLLPVGMPALIVAWTLQYEIVFYTVFGLGMRRPIVAVAAWSLIALIIHAPTPNPVFSLLVVEFFFGVLAAKAVEEGYVRYPLAGFFAALLAFGVLGATPEVRIVFGLSMAFIVIYLVRLEQAGRIRSTPTLLFLGTASYSIYLVHNPVIALTARFFHDWLTCFISCLITGTFAGIAYHLVIEAPLLRRFKPAPAAGLEGQA